MDKAKHILTFLNRLKSFHAMEAGTLDLVVDKNKTAHDLPSIFTETEGIMNDIGKSIENLSNSLQEYYEKTDNLEMLQKLEDLSK